jgi:hypothetical protein
VQWNPYGTAMTVAVDLLFVPDCPNAAVARQRIAEAVAVSGIAAAPTLEEIVRALAS